jgi:hypothetical protein
MKCGKKFLIDCEDYEKFCYLRWCDRYIKWQVRWNRTSQNYYVIHAFTHKLPSGSSQCTIVQLGRVIMGLGRGDPRRVDHINGDPLDNRKVNLRICTHAENMHNQRLPKNNTSGLKGASWDGKHWVAQIGFGGKVRKLGKFSTPEEAHAAYCKAAVELHGEFANFGKEPSSVRAALESSKAANQAAEIICCKPMES